jgi:TonB family protein
MRVLLTTLAILILTAARLAAQDPLASARELYATARYDEALIALDTLRVAAGTAVKPAQVRAVEQYRSLCLLALGREAEAEAAIANVVNVDPFYQPAEAEASPRVRGAFRDVRRRMLPEITAERYAIAKATFDRKEYEAAVEQFRQVITLLDDPDMQGRHQDLRTLSVGFYELSAASIKPPEPPPAPEPVAPQDPGPRIYSSEDGVVMPPVSVRQDLPRMPSNIMLMARDGVVEVIIDERGRVESAMILASVHPIYDAMLLSASDDWRYQPATVKGQPVKFRKRIQVSVARRE